MLETWVYKLRLLIFWICCWTEKNMKLWCLEKRNMLENLGVWAEFASHSKVDLTSMHIWQFDEVHSISPSNKDFRRIYTYGSVRDKYYSENMLDHWSYHNDICGATVAWRVSMLPWLLFLTSECFSDRGNGS